MSIASAANPRIGLVPTIAIYMLMLVFVGHLAEFHSVFAFRGLGTLTLFLAAFALFTAKKKQSLAALFKSTPLFKYILIFMAMVYLSVPFSVYKGGAFNMSKTYLYLVAFFFLLLAMAKGGNGLRTLLNSGMLVFFLLAAGLVKNYGTGRVSMFEHSYDPNDVAYVLISLLPLMFYYLQTMRSVFVKSLGYLVTLTAVVAIALTQSRGGAIAFCVVFLMYLRFEKINPKLFMAGVLVAVVGVFFLPDAFWQRMSTLTDITSDYNFQSDVGRLAIWSNGVTLFFQHFFTGVGAGQFSAASGMGGSSYMTAHNAFVQIGVELGVIGLICYTAMVFGPFKTLKRRIKATHMQERPHYLLYKGLYISFIAQLCGSMFLSVGYFHSLYYLLAVFIVLNAMDMIYDRKMQTVRPEPVQREKAERPRRKGPVMRERRSYKMRNK